MSARRSASWIKAPKPRPIRRARPALEALEDRVVPAPYMVTTGDDNGDNDAPINGSLRKAILQYNLGNNDSIAFDLGAGVEKTLNVKIRSLPGFSRPMILDGVTGGKKIEIKGMAERGRPTAWSSTRAPMGASCTDSRSATSRRTASC